MQADRAWLLAMDLSTPEGMVLLDGPGGTFSREIEGGSRVSRLFVEIEGMLSDAGTDASAVGLIGVCRGPGSFTGVRVAVMAAKILASALGATLVAPDTLQAMAMGVAREMEAVMVALDARRGQVYYAIYDLRGDYPQTLSAPAVAAPEEASQALSSMKGSLPAATGVVGTAVEAYARVWPEGLVTLRRSGAATRGLARLCRRMAKQGENSDPLRLLPLYLRRPDARERFPCGGERG